MLIKSQGEVHDLKVGYLYELLEIIDMKLLKINECISKSTSSNLDEFFERGEYFIGIGFVAIQQHLNESLIGMGLKQVDAYSLGVKLPTGISCIWIINAAANWWKHEPEWHNSEYFKKKDISKDGKKSAEKILAISSLTEYALSNVLASFSESQELSFIKNIVPYIEQWTKEVFANRVKASHEKS